jgi:hypothetical protein
LQITFQTIQANELGKFATSPLYQPGHCWAFCWSATEWIINNQFGSRNLSDYQRGVLALKLKPIFEARAKGNQGMRTDIPLNSAECIQPIETRQVIAKMAGVGKDTVRKVVANQVAKTGLATKTERQIVERMFAELEVSKVSKQVTRLKDSF